MRARHVIALLTLPAAASILTAPIAGAEPTEDDPTAPTCTTVAGGTYTGTGSTECQTPGNVQINETAPAPNYLFPWDGGIYGPEFGIGDPG